MKMDRLFNLSAEVSPDELQAFYGALAAGGEPPILELTEPPSSFEALPAVKYDALVQALLSWARHPGLSHLRVSEKLLEPRSDPLKASDIYLIVCLLADTINGNSRKDLSKEFRMRFLEALENRNTMGSIAGSANRSCSIVLPTHGLRFTSSPDLHAHLDGLPAIEENARTLYHNVWPSADLTHALRDPLYYEGEAIISAPDGVSKLLTREQWPKNYPLSKIEGKFRPLVWRGSSFREPASKELRRTLFNADKAVDDLGAAVYELVQNTEWHALGPGRMQQGAGCRLVRFKEDIILKQDLDEIGQFHRGLEVYARALFESPPVTLQGNVSSVTLLSVSVIDSGIGIARSAAASVGELHLYKPSSEIRYLRLALSKTLESTKRKAMSGIGLARVQQVLSNLNGSMMIRSGSVELFRDFRSRPFAPDGLDVKSNYINWVSPYPEDNDGFQKAGTAVTLFVPVEMQMETGV